MAAGGVAADIGDLDVESVVAVSEGLSVESAGEPDPVQPGLVRVVLAGAGRIDALGKWASEAGLPEIFGMKDVRKSVYDSPRHEGVSVADEAPAHERRGDRHAVPGGLWGGEGRTANVSTITSIFPKIEASGLVVRMRETTGAPWSANGVIAPGRSGFQYA